MPPEQTYEVRLHCIILAPSRKPEDLSSHLSELNQLYSKAGIKFLFDPSKDVEVETASPLSNDATGVLLTERALRYPGKLVIYLGTTLGNLSGEGPYLHINWVGAGGLAHEVGHYFHLHHTFIERRLDEAGVKEIADIIRQGVEASAEGRRALAEIQASLAGGDVVGNPLANGGTLPGQTFLDILDGVGSAFLDRSMNGDSADKLHPGSVDTFIKFPVEDTPACIHELPPGSPPDDACDPVKMTFLIPVTFSNGYTHTYTFKPDLANIMSYGHGCTNYERYFSAGQIRVMRSALERGSRNHLLGPALRWAGWFEVQGGGKTDAAPAAAVLGDRIYVFVKGSTGLIYHNSARDGHAFEGWAEVQGKGQTDAAPAAAFFGDRLHLFVKGSTGLIFHNSAPAGKPFGNWAEVQGAGQTDAAPSAAAFGSRLHVFVKGLGGGVFRNSSADGQNFGGWAEVQGKGKTDAAPSAASFQNALYAFVKGPTGVVYHCSSADGQGFGGWAEVQGRSLTGEITNAPVASVAYAGRLYVFAKGKNGRVYFNTARPGEGFRGWQEIPGAGATDAAPAVAVLNKRLYVFVKGPTGLIYGNSAEVY